MKVRWVPRDEANKFIIAHHRHHGRVISMLFNLGLYDDKEQLVGVACVGRPVARAIDHRDVCEVTRLCVLPNQPNACSQLYGACARVAREMGFSKIITYILESETGVSLKATGWVFEDKVAGKSWNTPARAREVTVVSLFGEETKYPTVNKQRWSKILV